MDWESHSRTSWQSIITTLQKVLESRVMVGHQWMEKVLSHQYWPIPWEIRNLMHLESKRNVILRAQIVERNRYFYYSLWNWRAREREVKTTWLFSPSRVAGAGAPLKTTDLTITIDKWVMQKIFSKQLWEPQINLNTFIWISCHTWGFLWWWSETSAFFRVRLNRFWRSQSRG